MPDDGGARRARHATRDASSAADALRCDRGASEVLSFALVFGLVVSSVAIVSIGGVDSLQSARDAEQINNAERAFDVLADNVDDIARRGAPSRATEISLGGAQLVTDDPVTVNVTAVDSGGDRTVVEREVRPVVYDGNGERALTYEAGAMFRSNREGALVLQGPPFMIDENRTYVQLVALQSDHVESAGGSTVLVRKRERQRRLVVADTSGAYDDLYVNVTSPRADLWDRYFQSSSLSRHENGTDAAGDRFVTYRTNAPENVFVAVVEIEVTIDQ